MTSTISKIPIRLHLTNVFGAGASQLLQSLLPALERVDWATIERIDLPDRGKLSEYKSNKSATVVENYRRFFPNSVSRVLECTILANRFSGETPLLVFGDLPLRCKGPQTVFVHQTNLLQPENFVLNFGWFKFWLARQIFRFNLPNVRSFIVQTEVMKYELELCYPKTIGRVYIVAQPVPAWLRESGLRRLKRNNNDKYNLLLFYPAANYDHKNHSLLADCDLNTEWPVENLTLTIDQKSNPAPQLSWVQCTGFLEPKNIIKNYSQADALLFLSKKESFGFPLVEAMFIGIPIVCPDLPYAHTLCGDQAFYFDPNCIKSLHDAICKLQHYLLEGWWPDYKSQLLNIPKDWETVASEMLVIANSKN
jgi:glycosyltransferase involved in cell wall biosynthesis